MLTKNKGRLIAIVDNDPEWDEIRIDIDSEKADIGTIFKRLSVSGTDNIKLEKGAKVQYVPNVKKTREVIYIAGSSGCGKSTWCGNYMKIYNIMFPDRKIYVLSNVSDDKAFKGIDISRLKISEQLIDEPLQVDEFNEDLKENGGCLILFDDIDGISDKKLMDSIAGFRNRVLEHGRHQNITCICTSHHLTNNIKTKTMLNEAHCIVVFPGSSNYQIDRLAKSYCSLDPACIRRLLRSSRGRWKLIYRHFPNFILSNEECYIV